MSVDLVRFGAWVKTQYPVYADLSDVEVGSRVYKTRADLYQQYLNSASARIAALQSQPTDVGVFKSFFREISLDSNTSLIQARNRQAAELLAQQKILSEAISVELEQQAKVERHTILLAVERALAKNTIIAAEAASSMGVSVEHYASIVEKLLTLQLLQAQKESDIHLEIRKSRVEADAYIELTLREANKIFAHQRVLLDEMGKLQEEIVELDNAGKTEQAEWRRKKLLLLEAQYHERLAQTTLQEGDGV